jgi:hypothetical protein
MIYRPRTSLRVGTAAAATLAVHGLFTLLLMLEDRDPLRRSLPPARQLVGVWIHLPMIPEPEPEPAVEPAVAPPPDRPTVARPARAITLAPATETADSTTAISTPVEDDSRPRIDWALEAQKLAAQRERDPENFSGPMQAMREPCKPHQSSMWPKKLDEVEDAPPTAEDALNPPRGSVMMGGTRVGIVDIGSLIGILTGGPKSEPNERLFDDMRPARRRAHRCRTRMSATSVPIV